MTVRTSPFDEDIIPDRAPSPSHHDEHYEQEMAEIITLLFILGVSVVGISLLAATPTLGWLAVQKRRQRRA